MWLSDRYEVPQELIDNPPSPAFRRFLLYWFGSNTVHTPERLRSIDELSPEEIPIAQQLVRVNLKTRRNRIINAAWLLRDTNAAPLLRVMLAEERDESRRLIIAGALWKLIRDPVFIECREKVKGTRLMIIHMSQILWLDDERALDFLIALTSHLVPDRLEANGPRALGLLNDLESGWTRRFNQEKPASYYRSHQFDPAFREHMLQAIHAENRVKRTLLL